MSTYGITKEATKNTIHEIDRDIRRSGNKIIVKCIEMEARYRPELAKCKVYSSHVYNEYDTVQRTFHFARETVAKLIKWRQDGNPLTWKWHSPLAMEGQDSGELAISEPIYASWLTRAYKGNTAISLMHPARMLGLCCPEYLVYARDDHRQQVDFDEKHISPRIEKIRECAVQGTPYMTVNADMKVSPINTYLSACIALSALGAGIREMPVYVESENRWTDDERARLASGDTSALWARMQ